MQFYFYFYIIVILLRNSGIVFIDLVKACVVYIPLFTECTSHILGLKVFEENCICTNKYGI